MTQRWLSAGDTKPVPPLRGSDSYINHFTQGFRPGLTSQPPSGLGLRQFARPVPQCGIRRSRRDLYIPSRLQPAAQRTLPPLRCLCHSRYLIWAAR